MRKTKSKKQERRKKNDYLKRNGRTPNQIARKLRKAQERAK